MITRDLIISTFMLAFGPKHKKTSENTFPGNHKISLSRWPIIEESMIIHIHLFINILNTARFFAKT